MLKSVDEEEKVTNNVYTLGGNQDAWFLTEGGRRRKADTHIVCRKKRVYVLYILITLLREMEKSNLTSSKYWYETTYKQDGNCNQVIGGGANLLHRILY